MLIFDEEKINELKKTYQPLDQYKAKEVAPEANNQPEKKVIDTPVIYADHH